jgi:dihydropteroate synthase
VENRKEIGDAIFYCREHGLPLGKKTYIMGILNVTPDSFSDGGRYTDLDVAMAQARRMLDDGADIIDIGGESTRPGFTPVDADEECRRVLPVIERLVAEIDVPISVDTSKALVARRALEAGAHIINDIWGLHRESDIARIVAEFGAGIIVMHNRDMEAPRGPDIIADIIEFFRVSIDIARLAGIREDAIVVDPGIGFGKDLAGNLETMLRLKELNVLGFPVLLGPSRKSMIGKVLNLPANDRVEGTMASVVVGIVHGVDFVRVHDVKEMKRAATMTDAIVRGVSPNA